MKILATICHYYKAGGEKQYGSLGGNARARADALGRTIMALHEVAATPGMLHPPDLKGIPANEPTCHKLDVVVCTTGADHLLDSLDLPDRLYRQHATEAEPKLLGFECHDVLRDGLGKYDFFCYQEDDIVIRDPWFFAKHLWFATWAGPDRVLQPNRYELSAKARVHKVYIDGDIAVKHTRKHQSLTDMPDLMSRAMNLPLRFRGSPNPHAGCFFLNGGQMRKWTDQDYFLDRDISFMGPLESAATLGVLRCFDLFKPAPECAHFLEVLHADNRYLDNRLQIDRRLRFKVGAPK